MGFLQTFVKVLIIFNLIAYQIVKSESIKLDTTKHINTILSSPGTNKQAAPSTSTLHDSNYEPVDSTSTLAATLRNTFCDIEELIRSLIQSLAANVPEITKGTEELLKTLTNRIVSALDTFSKKLIDAGGKLVRDTFESMQRQLQIVKDEFQYLSQNVDDQFDWAVTQLNETLMNSGTDRIDQWAANIKHELRSVNDTRFYEQCQLVDDFIRRSTEQLQNCCNITINPMRSLCQKAREVLAEALRVLADAMDRMQICLEDKNSYLEYMIPCINVAYDEISALIARAAELRHHVSIKLPVKILYSRSCIAIVLVQMEQRQSEMETDLRTTNKI